MISGEPAAPFSRIAFNTAALRSFLDWRETNDYDLFLKRIIDSHSNGYNYFARFDISAYYDTISHHNLVKSLDNQKPLNSATKMFLNLLKHWTNNDPNSQVEHGIPQGPDPSGFFGEFYLAPLDKSNYPNTMYFRW